MNTSNSPLLAFISTRTEEMSLERRAAVEAAIAADVTPVTYDASIHRLMSTQMPPGAPSDTPFVDIENRRGVRRPIWEHIATFLEMCDVFVGVFYHTLGPADDAAASQPWLQFELYRFIASHEAARKAAWFTQADGAWAWKSADDAVRDPGFGAELRRAIEAQGKDSDELREFLRESVWLYQWCDNRGMPFANAELQSLLAPFKDQSCRRFSDRIMELNNRPTRAELRPVRSAHAELFGLLRQRFSGARASHLARHPPLPDLMVYLSIEDGHVSPLQPGALYVLLRACFGLGLRLDCLMAGSDDSPRIRGIASPFASSWDDEEGPLEMCLQKLLRQGLGLPTSVSSGPQVRAATVADRARMIEESEVKVFRRRQREQEDCITYRVRVGDFAGSLWTIVSIATAFDATIVHLSYDRRWSERPEPQKIGFSHSSLVVDFELGLAFVGQAGEDFWTDFEYHLKCAPGYISSSVVSTVGVS